MSRVVREVRPRYVLVENSPALVVRGLGRILSDLAQMGYDARWGVLGAQDAGLEMLRERIWILASNDCFRASGLVKAEDIGVIRQWGKGREKDLRVMAQSPFLPSSGWPKSLIRRGDDEMAGRVDRTKAIGNGQIPVLVKLAWETLSA